VAPIPDNIAACLMKSRRELGMVTFLYVVWKGAQPFEFASQGHQFDTMIHLEREDCMKGMR
jgi:hypothetical protein